MRKILLGLVCAVLFLTASGCVSVKDADIQPEISSADESSSQFVFDEQQSSEEEQIPSKSYTYVVEDVFEIISGGCVTIGYVQGDTMELGDTIHVSTQNGEEIDSVVSDMEINAEKATEATNTYVAILLLNVEKEQLQNGDVITYLE